MHVNKGGQYPTWAYTTIRNLWLAIKSLIKKFMYIKHTWRLFLNICHMSNHMSYVNNICLILHQVVSPIGEAVPDPGLETPRDLRVNLNLSVMPANIIEQYPTLVHTTNKNLLSAINSQVNNFMYIKYTWSLFPIHLSYVKHMSYVNNICTILYYIMGLPLKVNNILLGYTHQLEIYC